MAEARGGKEDKRLKTSFARLCQRGTDWMDAESIVTRLTSQQLKIKPKSSNIAGLQLAELIAHPSFKHILNRQNKQKMPESFGKQIADILIKQKYDRHPKSGGNIGYGTKWLP